jgi:Transposase DDE domain
MPYKANEARRHRIPRARYRVTNWPEYDGALQRRGSLTVWVTPEALAAWHPPRTGRRGRSPRYADLAIETGHLCAWPSVGSGGRPRAFCNGPSEVNPLERWSCRRRLASVRGRRGGRHLMVSDEEQAGQSSGMKR